MTMNIIEKAKKHFYETIKIGEDPWDLLTHIPEAEKWAQKILERYPEADREIIMLAVWLHDTAYFTGDTSIDHAIRGEEMAHQFLKKEGYDEGRLEKVCHCIRAHRNGDVKPDTLEARLVCLIDSISHFTYAPYIAMARDGRAQQALDKLERDYRDLRAFPEIAKELEPIYKAWKILINELMISFWYEEKKDQKTQLK